MVKNNSDNLKKEMLEDAKKARVARLLMSKGVNLDKNLAATLIQKYGKYAYDIVLQSVVRPRDVNKEIGEGFKNSRNTIMYFVENDVPAEQFIKIVNYGNHQVSLDEVKTELSSTKTNDELKNTLKQQTHTAIKYLNRNKTTVSIDSFVPSGTYPMSAQETKIEDELVEKQLRSLKAQYPNGVTFAALNNEGYGKYITSNIITPKDYNQLIAGKDGHGFGESVYKIGRCGKSECGQGVRRGLTTYMNRTYGLNMPTVSKDFYDNYCPRDPNNKKLGGTSAAQTLYKAFEDPSPAGDYFTVLCYDNTKDNCRELKELPNGSTVFYEGKKDKTLRLANGTIIPHPGHVETFYNGSFCSGTGSVLAGQREKNSYGKHYRLAIPNDTIVGDELLRKMIKENIHDNTNPHDNKKENTPTFCMKQSLILRQGNTR